MDSHLRPNNFQGYQNGSFNEDTFMYPNGAENDFTSNTWEFNAHNDVTTSSAQPTSSYLNWPQTTATAQDLDSYGRSYSRSPSNLQQTPFPGYGDPRQFTQSPYDPSLIAPSQNGSSAFSIGNTPYGQQMQSGTIAPRALETGRPQTVHQDQNLGGQGHLRGGDLQSVPEYARPTISQAASVDQAALCAAIPKGDVSGIFSIVDYDKLVKSTSSRRLSAFINVSQHDFEYPINRAAIPAPVRRKSRNELRKLARDDPKLLSRLGKRHKAHSPASKVHKNPIRTWQSTPGVQHENVSSSEESSDEDDSSEYSEDELAEPSPLPPRRPDNPLEAVKYDTIKALWQSKRFEVDSDNIRNGLKDYWEVVRTIRDRWKTDSAAVTDAEEKKRIGELPLLKSRVKDQRDMIEVAFKTALEHGHPSILEFENAAFLYLLYQFLLDRFKENDFEGPLSRSILEILAICVTLNEETLEKTRLGKVLPRFAKKGSAEIQALVKRIETKASENSKKKAEEDNVATEKKPGVVLATRSPPKTQQTSEPMTLTAGVKRSAPSNGSDQAAKRISSGPGPSVSAPSSAVKTAAGLKRPVSATPGGRVLNGTPSGVQPVKAKASTAVNGSASTIKKSVTAKAAVPSVVASAIKSIEKKVGPSVAPAAAAKPAFSFAATMANLTKPKEKEPTPKAAEEKQPLETAAEKAKRIRKEQRRKMRVTFKPDSQLVQIKYFTHDVDEELGHDESMIRDVSDVGGEGRMFKQHKDMMEIDEEDDGPSEEDLRPYHTPLPTDFTDVDPEERKRNYVPYGGGELQPQSPEKVFREEEDGNRLMVVYTQPGDIPPCPREPADPYNGETISTKDFGEPDPQGIVASRLARLGIKKNAQAQQPLSHTPGTGANPDISAILALISPQQPQPSQPVQHVAQNPMSEIQRILANLPQNAGQAPQPAAPASQAGIPPNLASIFANLQPQGNNGPITPPIQPPQQSAGPTIDPTPAGLAAFFTQFHNGQGGAAAVPTNPFSPFGMPGAGFNLPNPGQAVPQQQNQQTFENEERRRYRESGGGDNDQDDASRGRSGKAVKGKWADKRFTQPCKYFKSGKCQKGANCTYLHE
ncbi:hypothetical protein MBLNU459_g2228t3 [Dothideomycetes sp. NU459]